MKKRYIVPLASPIELDVVSQTVIPLGSEPANLDGGMESKRVVMLYDEDEEEFEEEYEDETNNHSLW